MKTLYLMMVMAWISITSGVAQATCYKSLWDTIDDPSTIKIYSKSVLLANRQFETRYCNYRPWRNLLSMSKIADATRVRGFGMLIGEHKGITLNHSLKFERKLRSLENTDLDRRLHLLMELNGLDFIRVSNYLSAAKVFSRHQGKKNTLVFDGTNLAGFSNQVEKAIKMMEYQISFQHYLGKRRGHIPRIEICSWVVDLPEAIKLKNPLVADVIDSFGYVSRVVICDEDFEDQENQVLYIDVANSSNYGY